MALILVVVSVFPPIFRTKRNCKTSICMRKKRAAQAALNYTLFGFLFPVCNDGQQTQNLNVEPDERHHKAESAVPFKIRWQPGL